MTDSLLDKFSEMSDREILIATCANFDAFQDSVKSNLSFINQSIRQLEASQDLTFKQITSRIDNHSKQREIKEEVCKKKEDDILKSFSELSNEQRKHAEEIIKIKEQRSVKREIIAQAGGILGILAAAATLWGKITGKHL